MNIGQLNYRCRVEYPARTNDATYGGSEITWNLLCEGWCSCQDNLPSKSEAVKSGLVVNINQTLIRMRYRMDIDSSMRVIVYRPDETVYQIASGPAVIGNKEGLEMMCEAFSSQGG